MSLSIPNDSTQGLGPGFYWFGGLILLIFLLGVVKAFWDDKEWRGRVFNTSNDSEELKKKIKTGLKQSEAGQIHTTKEAKVKLQKWLKN